MGQAKARKAAMGDAYGKPPSVLWHYTVAMNIRSIAATGLRSVEREDGICWFTSSCQIDPTSVAALSQELAAINNREWMALWRIGIDSSLAQWLPSALKADAELGERLAKALSNTKGADIRHWYLSPELEPSQLLVYQRLELGGWVKASPGEAPGIPEGTKVHVMHDETKHRSYLAMLQKHGAIQLLPKPDGDHAMVLNIERCKSLGLGDKYLEPIFRLVRLAHEEVDRWGGSLVLDDIDGQMRDVHFKPKAK